MTDAKKASRGSSKGPGIMYQPGARWHMIPSPLLGPSWELLRVAKVPAENRRAPRAPQGCPRRA
eukprot:1115755-Pyramimonas_sp.AAC.1